MKRFTQSVLPFATLACALLGYQISAQSLGASFWVQHGIASLLLGATLWFCLFRTSLLGWEPWKFWLFLWALSFLVYYRRDVFYHWDDYDVLAHFAEAGIQGLIHTHNEHFMPLFFLLYFLEVKIFGISYGGLILVSTLLHATTAFCISKLLFALSKNSIDAVFPARLLAVLWMIAGIHIELMNWAFTQQSMTCELFSIGAMLATLRFMRSGRARDGILIALTSIAAALCFGNGLRLPFVLGALVLFEYLAAPNQKIIRWRAFSALAVSALASGAMFLIYSSEGSGTGVPLTEVLQNAHRSVAYIYIGTQLGTVLRGLNLCPSVYLEAVQNLLPGAITLHVSPELIFATAGSVLSLLMLYAIRQEGKWRYWILGQIVCAASFALPSLARWRLGMFQSLAMRYQYHALLGLAIILLPIFIRWFSAVSVPKTHSPTLARIWIGIYCATQLFLSIQLDYFTARGRDNRAYTAKLKDWYLSGPDTASRGRAPIMPNGLSPTKSPEEIYLILNSLNRTRFPK